MNINYKKIKPKFRWLGIMLLLVIALSYKSMVSAVATAPIAIDLSSSPLISQKTPANVVLALSVEYPTSGQSYQEYYYIDKNEYLGYFNSNRCYTYTGNFGNVDTGYFQPVGNTDLNYYCNSTTSYSGNFLNFATMTAPDIMRLALTGGNRRTDTQTQTILDRGNIQNVNFTKKLSGSLVNIVAPSNQPGDISVSNYSTRIDIQDGKNNFILHGVMLSVDVCDATEGPTRTIRYGTGINDFYNFCTKYNYNGITGYKPEGQIQQKSDSLRLAIFSYLLDNVENRYGGVLRAPMKYVGPNTYSSNGTLSSNLENEWNANTGIFIDKPINDSTSNPYQKSGVINYVNKFGTNGYKTFDPVGELWYESLRYLQGLSPSSASTTGMTEAMKDNYPVYSTWTDPLTSACQRNNYILGIGDTNTHWDRSQPGLTVAEQSTLNSGGTNFDFSYGITGTITGSSTGVNAHDWTKIIDAYERSGATPITYTDSQNRSQSTSGQNPTSNSLGNLDTTPTGSASRSSYHWAGLSYWANTQPIRKDTINSISMDKVRVKTFMIDVDENKQGSITSQIKATNFYLAGKYGYFNDTAQTGNPFNGTDTSRWADNTGAPNGYVLASQPKKLIAGIKAFFEDSAKNAGSFSAAAISTPKFSTISPNGNTFEQSYSPGEWSGTIQSINQKLNTTTYALTAGTIQWDAGKILTNASTESGTVVLPAVKPVDRNIITYIRGATSLLNEATTFSTVNSLKFPASLNTVPYTTPTVADSNLNNRINYIRGDRTKELDGSFRVRTSIMGDVINSGPVYKAGATESTTGDGYAIFFNSMKSRTPVVYAGANDGMLHAFKASDGQELFSYIPGALLDSLANLTSKNYVHQPYVDAVPYVEEVKVGSAWKTVLLSGMGGGAQGVFALDVTNPTAFTKDNVMFEFTDKDDAQMGNVVGTPVIVTMLTSGTATTPVYKSYAVISSGYNNYKADGYQNMDSSGNVSNDQALFFLDLSKPMTADWVKNSNYFKFSLNALSSTASNGLAQPGFRTGNVGEAVEFFAGDLQGSLWKFSFPNGISTATLSTVVKTVSSKTQPIFTATTSNTSTVTQAITSAPTIYPYINGRNMIIFGTGRLLQSTDRSLLDINTIYGIWDSGKSTSDSLNLGKSNLIPLTLNQTTLTIPGTTTTFTATTGGKRGWYIDIPQTGERFVIDSSANKGVVLVKSITPPTSECSGSITSRNYYLSPSTGNSIRIDNGTDIGKPIWFTTTTTTPNWGKRSTGGQRIYTGGTPNAKSGESITQLNPTSEISGRVYWREVRDYNQVSQ